MNSCVPNVFGSVTPRQLARRRRPYVTADVGLGPDHFREVHELVRAERVLLRHPAPMRVDLDRPLGSRSYAFPPVVLVGEAAAGPADHRDLQVSESLQNVVAVSPRFRNLGVFTDPDAAVDSGAQMLGELAEQLPINLRSEPVGVDGEAGGGRLLGQDPARYGGGGSGG